MKEEHQHLMMYTRPERKGLVGEATCLSDEEGKRCVCVCVCVCGPFFLISSVYTHFAQLLLAAGPQRALPASRTPENCHQWIWSHWGTLHWTDAPPPDHTCHHHWGNIMEGCGDIIDSTHHFLWGFRVHLLVCCVHVFTWSLKCYKNFRIANVP